MDAGAPRHGEIQLAQANAVNVPVPGTLETVVIPTEPDTLYDLPEGAEGVQASETGGNLLLAFPNGGLVEFSGFASASAGVQFHSPDKGTLDAASFIRELQSDGEGAPPPVDSPNFEPGPSPEILPGLSPVGALAATELHITVSAAEVHQVPPPPLHLSDVVVPEQPLGNLFHLPIDYRLPAPPAHEMTYSLADTHAPKMPSVIGFHFIGG